jgi:regulator of sigma E protease
MEVLENIAAFVVALGAIIFFHEFGHFITAKAFGMRVFIFSFGFGKRLLGFQWGDTDCRLSLIPLGGYVKLEGEPDDALSEDAARRGDGDDFTSRPRWQRILVYLAGPGANVVLTVGVMTLLYVFGGAPDGTLSSDPVVVVAPDSPAQRAGMQTGDHIRAIDGQVQKTWENVLLSVATRPNADLVVRVQRADQVVELDVHATAVVENKMEFGRIGVSPLVQIGSVIAGSAAEEAGLRTDDGIMRIDGQAIRSFNDIPPLVAESAGKPLALDIYRDGTTLELSLAAKDNGSGLMIGIRPKAVFRQFPLPAALVEATRWTWGQVEQTFSILGRLLTGGISPRTMSGPVGIAEISGDAAREGGTRALAYLVAVISIQIGILNLFPVPPLDGGHLAILFGESVVRRDFSETVKIWILNAGTLALFLLIGLVLYSDISKTEFLGQYLW